MANKAPQLKMKIWMDKIPFNHFIQKSAPSQVATENIHESGPRCQNSIGIRAPSTTGYPLHAPLG